MRSVWATTAFVLFIIVITLVYKLPAKFVYQKFSSVSSLELVGISGSIWSGHIDSIITPQLTLSQLSWQLSVWPLLVGDVDLQWKLEDPAVQLQGEISLSGEELSLIDIHGHIDLVGLGSRLPAQDILLAGVIDINISQLEFKKSELINVTGLVKWETAQLLSPTNIKFGDFKADLSNSSSKLLANLSDMGGPISLRGVFSLSTQRSYDYTLEIAVRDTSVPGLLEGFNQLGQHNDNGVVTLRGNGVLF